MSTSLSFSKGSGGGEVDGFDVSQANLSTCNWYRNSRCNALLTYDTGEQAVPSDVKSSVRVNTRSGKEIFPVETKENSPTEKTAKSKKEKKASCTFFKRLWKAVKRPFIRFHRRNKVAPLVPPPHLDANLANPELRANVCLDDPELKAKTNPAISDLEAGTNSDFPGLKSDINPVNPDKKANPPVPDTQEKWKPIKQLLLRFYKRNDVAPFVLPPQRDADPVPELKGDTDPADSKLKAGAYPADLKPSPASDDLYFEPAAGSVHSKYDIALDRVLGSGGFGKVYEGIRKSDGKLVAIKCMWRRKNDRYIVIPGYSKPLLTEVALMLMLRKAPISPFIIEMYEWYEEPDRFMLVLEYPKPCETLTDFIKFRGKLSESTARCLLRQAVQAVQHSIEHGVFHNDIHTHNILLDRKSLSLKLIDFGSGYLFSDAAYDSSKYIGAPGYCPPEVFTKPTYRAIPTNVWSLGVVLYVVVNGVMPFSTDVQPSDNLQSVNRFISKQLRDLIGQCLAIDPTKRPTLEQVLDHAWFNM